MYNTFIAHINITQRHEIYKEAIICILNCSFEKSSKSNLSNVVIETYSIKGLRNNYMYIKYSLQK